MIDDRQGDRGNARLLALATRGMAWLAQGRIEAARSALLDFARGSRSRCWERLSLHADALAWLAAAQGQGDAKARILGHADAVRPRPVNAPGSGTA